MKFKNLLSEIKNDKKNYLPNSIKRRLYYYLSKNNNIYTYRVIKWYRIKKYFENNKKSIYNLLILLLVNSRVNYLSRKYSLELTTNFGKNMKIYHNNVVCNKASTIGNNVKFHGNNCLGGKNSKQNFDSPTIGNNVDIGFGAIIIGKINVGDNVIIGAGSIVTKSIPDNSIVAGNPAKIIGKVQ